MTSGLSGPAFDICLLEGQVEEHAVAHILCKATFEVKNDKRARETGNVFVEFRQGSTIKGEGAPFGNLHNRGCVVCLQGSRRRADLH